MDFHRFQLSNGIRVVAVPTMPGSVTALQVWFSCGSRTETDEEHGLAHFNEHMFFRGGRDFPDAQHVEDELDLLGEKYNAVTFDESVFYFIMVGSRYIERAAHILSDMLVYARMDRDDFEKERGAVLQELGQVLDDPEEVSYFQFKRLLFGAHPLGRDPIGTKKTINRFTVEDVRRYKDRFYGPPNAVISIAGGFELNEIKLLLERYFGGIPQKEKVVWVPFEAGASPPAARLISRAGVAQAHLHVGGLAPSARSKDAEVLNVLKWIMNKRLFMKVRIEHGLVYAVAAEIDLLQDTGVFLISAGTDTDRRKITKTLSLVLEEMGALKSGVLDDEEVEKAKVAYHNRVDLETESSDAIAGFAAAHELLIGKAKTLEELHADIDAVTRDRIVYLAREIWREEFIHSLLLTTSFPSYEEKFIELRRALRERRR